MNTNREIVQDQSTNNLHYRGENKADGTPTALCNKRYKVFTYDRESTQANFRAQWNSWNSCPNCERKAHTG